MIDLKNMLMIIETCQKRGAFHAEEMSGVGALYNKLKKANDSHENVRVCEDGRVCDRECQTGECKKNEGEVEVEGEVEGSEGEEKKTCCLEGVCPVDGDCERLEGVGYVGT
jgi:hypothetical protein